MLRTTPSLLSLAPGPILAVEFFASQKPLWETPVVGTPRLKRERVVSPAPTEQARDSLAHEGLDKRGRAVSVQMVILQWREQGSPYSDQICADLSFSRQKAQDTSCFPVTLEPGTASSGAAAVPCTDPPAF